MIQKPLSQVQCVMESFISAQNREDLELGVGLGLEPEVELGPEPEAGLGPEPEAELDLKPEAELDLDAIVLALAATVPVQETAAQNRQNICMMVNAINYDTTFLFPHRYRHRNRVM